MRVPVLASRIAGGPGELALPGRCGVPVRPVLTVGASVMSHLRGRRHFWQLPPNGAHGIGNSSSTETVPARIPSVYAPSWEVIGSHGGLVGVRPTGAGKENHARL